jgi:hypothetical protein
MHNDRHDPHDTVVVLTDKISVAFLALTWLLLFLLLLREWRLRRLLQARLDEVRALVAAG